MARIVHGFYITKGRKHTIKMVIFLVAVIAAVIIIGKMSGNSGYDLAIALSLSFFRLTVAYFISLIVATIVAILVSSSRVGNALIPVLDLLQNLPSFALIPIFAVWLGYTNLMIIIFAATSILWPILFYMLHALKTARKDLEDAANMFGARGLKKILYFSLPIAFPAVVTGSIVGFSIGWEAIIGIEIIGISKGIGSFLNSYTNTNHEMLLVGIASLLLVVFLVNRLVWMPLLKKSQLYAE